MNRTKANEREGPEIYQGAVMKLTKAFFGEIKDLIASARATVARGVDLVQVYTNFEIGRRIVQQEQKGKGRAKYGEEVLIALSERLVNEFGRGYSRTNLEYMRKFFLVFEERASISQSMTGKLPSTQISQSLAGILPSLSTSFDRVAPAANGRHFFFRDRA